MKKKILLLGLLMAGLVLANAQVTVTSSTGLYEEPSLKSIRIATVIEGENVILGEKTGEFWKAVVGKKSGYLHESCLSNYVDPKKSGNTEPVIAPVITVLPAKSTQDTVNFEQYGGLFSIGIALGGGGLIGLPVRLFPTRNFAIELGVYARGMIATKTFVGLNLNGGLNFYFKDSFNPKKKKFRHDGAFLRGGKTFYNADIKDIIIMGGWTRDHFKLGTTDRVFTLELGVGLNSMKYTETTSGSWGYETTTYSGNTPMLFWKFAWSLFPKKH